MINSVLELEKEFDRRITELDPVDIGAWLGYPASGFAAYSEPQQLMEALARQQIRQALVSHKIGELMDARAGNEALERALPHMPGCGGVMTLLPPGTGEMDDTAGCVDSLLDKGFRAARIAPKLHRYSMKIPAVPEMLSTLEQRGVPLLIPIGQTSWDEIAPTASAFPRLAVVVEGTGHHEYLNIRSCLTWLTVVTNLLVVTQGLFLCGELELLAGEIGEHRILFSSNQPMDDPAAGLSLLAFSELPPAARRRIARENALHLIASAGKGGYFA
ncbi:MAG: amidohydrolase family protein [bacterium]|nr:amidohydrolase family protein [Candidatus Sumerlaeota bacterium]